jgi:phage shock protein A
MGFFVRLARLIRANLDDVTGDAGDPEQKLDQAIAEMNEQLIEMKNLVSASAAEQTRLACLGPDAEILDHRRRATEDLKRALVLLNAKIEEAKARRDTLRLRGRTAKVAEAIHASTSGVEKENVSDLLDRLEAQVTSLEMQARVSAELEPPASPGALGSGPTAERAPRQPVARALGPVSTDDERKQPTVPVEPGDEKRTGR